MNKFRNRYIQTIDKFLHKGLQEKNNNFGSWSEKRGTGKDERVHANMEASTSSTHVSCFVQDLYEGETRFNT